jgi:hypothetical protein
MQLPVQSPFVQHPLDGMQLVVPPAVQDFMVDGQL